MIFQTHYEPVPVTEKPDKDGWYTLVADKAINILRWYNSEHGWDLGGGYGYTHWLRPRPDTVLLTREEVDRIFQAGADHELDRHNPDLETYINNQFK